MKAMVLSSGGVDSTTCISLAVEKHGVKNVSTVSVYYGQKHQKELECAKKVADFYALDHYEIELSNVFKHSDTPLLKNSKNDVPLKSYAEQIEENGEGVVSTYVPFRNGTILSVVATLATSICKGEEVEIYIGAHSDDAAGNAYADCSLEFIEAINKAISIGTYGKCRVVAPFVGMTKADVVATGLKLRTPYEYTWSCYNGGDKPCGKCGTCIDRAKAFELNGVKDPAGGNDVYCN